MTYASSLDKIPKGQHWVIITTRNIHIPGDERSRTHPGHGYPASTETVFEYQYFTDEVEWKNEVTKQSRPKSWGSPDPFVAMKVVPATIELSVSVSIKE